MGMGLGLVCTQAGLLAGEHCVDQAGVCGKELAPALQSEGGGEVTWQLPASIRLGLWDYGVALEG